jgi:hypothetical protein
MSEYIFRMHKEMTSRDSSVGIATGYGAGLPIGRSYSPCGGKNFHFSMSSRLTLEPTQPPNQWVPDALSPRVKQPGREADHSPPTRAEVKYMWIYTCTPPHVKDFDFDFDFMA